jgi:uncharacterized damage-inducible protein DinB
MSFQEIQKQVFLTQVDFFKATLGGTPEDKRDWKPDESSMSAKDMIEHLAGANHYFSAMITGQEPPTPPENPPQLNYDQAMQMFDESVQLMANTLTSVSDENLNDARETPFGHSVNVRFAMSVPGSHTAYHWGQLSYLQKQYGDEEDHFLAPTFPLGRQFK